MVRRDIAYEFANMVLRFADNTRLSFGSFVVQPYEYDAVFTIHGCDVLDLDHLDLEVSFFDRFVGCFHVIMCSWSLCVSVFSSRDR